MTILHVWIEYFYSCVKAKKGANPTAEVLDDYRSWTSNNMEKATPLLYCLMNSTWSGVHVGLLTFLPLISPSNGQAESATRQSMRALSAMCSPACVAAG